MEARIKLEKGCRNASEIKELVLDNCNSLHILGLTDEFCKLELLSLSNIGLISLKGYPELPNVTKLELNGNDLDDGLNYLVNSPNLCSLNLSNNKFTTLETLKPLKKFKYLKSLDLINNEVTKCRYYRKRVFALLPCLQILDGFDQNHEEVNEDSYEDKCMALFQYVARHEEDLSIEKGDKLGIIDDSDEDWTYVYHLSNKRCGYVPRNYVGHEKSEMEEYIFDSASRKDAEKLLMLQPNPRGSFMIRYCEQTKGFYSLSIKNWNPEKMDHVMHYKVKVTENERFYITPRKKFNSLKDLVTYYKKSAYGLCHKLTIACQKTEPPIWDLSHNTRDEYEISRETLQLLQKLGSGTYGDVWFAKWNDTMPVAVKSLKFGMMSRKEFLQEAAILKHFRHENVVSLFAICSTADPILIVTELMINGSLILYLRSVEGKNLGLDVLINMSAQVASGMSYLERLNLIHRDIAARNILVGEYNIVKIADFGLARVIKDSAYVARKGSTFPSRWTAPEAALLGKYSIKSDVWSFGILLYEIFSHGGVPYPDIREEDVVKQVKQGYRMSKPSNSSDSIYEKMKDCWNEHPDNRPTFEFFFFFLTRILYHRNRYIVKQKALAIKFFEYSLVPYLIEINYTSTNLTLKNITIVTYIKKIKLAQNIDSLCISILFFTNHLILSSIIVLSIYAV